MTSSSKCLTTKKLKMMSVRLKTASVTRRYGAITSIAGHSEVPRTSIRRESVESIFDRYRRSGICYLGCSLYYYLRLLWMLCRLCFPPGMGVDKRIFSVSLVFPTFQNNQNTGYLNGITFIFDRCHHSWAAEAPDKYERDWKHLTYTFSKSKFPVTDKLMNESLETSTPGSLQK